MVIKKSYLFLIGAVFLAALVWWLERPGSFKEGDVVAVSLFPKLDAAQVTQMEIEHLISGVRLRKNEQGIWEASELMTDLQKRLKEEEGQKTKDEEWIEADQGKVTLVLDTLAGLTGESMVSQNPEKQGSFEVNQIGQKVRALDKDGTVLAYVYLGKQGPDFLSTYVRKEGEEVVYLVRQYLKGQFSPLIENWKAKDEKETGNQENHSKK